MNNLNFEKIYRRNLKYFISKILQKIFLSLNLKTKTDVKVLFNKDIISANIFVNGVYEKDQLDFLINLTGKFGLLKKQSVVDIGSNIGNHSLYFSKYFKTVYAFEAHPKIFSVQKINVSETNNIKPFNFGLGNTNKNSIIYENQFNLGGSSVVNRVGKKIKIKLKKLDSIKNLKNLRLIKIDVEDFELEVLKGSIKTLKKFKPIVAFESWSNHKPKISLLKKLGYNIYIVDNFNPFNFVILKAIYNLKDIFIGRKFKLIEYSKDFHKRSFDQLIAIPSKKILNLNKKKGQQKLPF